MNPRSFSRRKPARPGLRSLVVALAAGLLAAGTGLAAPQPAQAAGDWKVPRLTVMPLGDSITAGVGSSGGNGYRAELRGQLSAHAGTFEYVGSQREQQMQHEGHRGWRIDQLSTAVERWLATARPNVVLLHIGANDVNYQYETESAPARLGHLVDQITAAAPQTTVLVSSLSTSTAEGTRERMKTFNAALPRLVEERRSKGFKVGYVDMGALTTKDLADWLHPNDAGYRKMADAFAGGVARAATDGWIRERVDVRPAPHRTVPGDHRVDVDGDGKADYLAVETDGSVQGWLNKGNGNWAGRGTVATGVGAPGDGVRFADLDGDRKADYLAVDDNGSVRAWLNKGGDGQGGWESRGTVATGVGAPRDKVRFADLDGDGKADYLVVDDDGSVRAWINKGGDGHGGWDGRGTLAAGAGAGASGDRVRFADLNGDGRADYLAVDDNGSVRAWLNPGDGNGAWASRGTVAAGVGAPGDTVRLSDVNGDGRADYLVVDEDGSVRAWLNRSPDGRDDWSAGVLLATGPLGSPGSRVRI
ncbi:FG-GAP-like repeat-containing protein [Streptomyces cinnamoneus]|uniref:FG-GAP-like repeat-containing protein n=1 Tax=Streptomyces cinnamoneus TaxID=53446 RepID=UPI00167E3600|nr:FG-GAP-like repeat-containing protein [Streptomyces cinnamoneus]